MQQSWTVESRTASQSRGTPNTAVASANGEPHPQLRITILPPVLVSDDGDLEGVGRFRSVLNSVDYSRRGQKQHDYDQDGNDRPRQLNLCAPVELSRLATRIPSSPPKLNDPLNQQGEHDDKDESGDNKHKFRQVKD